MLKNYILSAWRGARRDLSGFAINIIGLLVGFTVFTLAYSFAHYLTTFDTSYDRADRSYAVGLKLVPGNFFRRDIIPFAFIGAADGLTESSPDIELAGRVIANTVTYEKDGEYLPLQIRGVDADTLTIFDIEATQGTLDIFSDKLEAALISEREAKHLFGDENPIGKTLTLNGKHSVMISGVFKDLPANTHLMVNPEARSAFDFLISTAYYEKLAESEIFNNWESIDSMVNTYVVGREGVSQEQLNAALSAHMKSNQGDEEQTTFEGLYTIPIQQIQLDAMNSDGIDLVLVVRGVGALILGLAVLNAISLASARMINRSKEIGLRRVFGARKGELAFQFITENTAYALLALAAAVLVSFDLFGLIREITGMDLQFASMLDLPLVFGLVVSALLVGLISSLYPILLFSGLLKNVSLNRTLSLATSSAWLRKALVASQFTVVSGLVLAFFVMQMQNQHMLDNVHKVDTNRMAAITGMYTPGMSKTVAETVKRLPGVESVSRNGLPPYGGNTNITIMNIPGIGENVQFRMIAVDRLYFDQLGITPLAGRTLDDTRELDHLTPDETRDNSVPQNFMVNETAMRLLGFSEPEAIIGHTFTELEDGEEPSAGDRTVVGVVPDLRLGIPREEIRPTLYWVAERRLTNLTIVYEKGAPIDIRALNKAWQDVDPSASTVEASPLASMAASALTPYETANKAMIAVTFVTVTMAAAGLYALTAYLAAGKRREVSIRKVHGATIGHILQRLMWQFTKPVALALVLALPITAYLLETSYLASFAERIDLNALPVVGTIGLVLLMAWVTTLTHIVRAARSRPAVVLRSE